MAEENKGAAPAAPASTSVDEIKNLKAEMSRKQDATASALELLKAQIAAMAKPVQAPEPRKRVSVFENEEEFARNIEETTTQRIEARIAEQNAVAARQQRVLSELYVDFPEINQPDSELTKKALEIYNGFSSEDKNSPLAYKDAVKSAALDLGIRPKSKRASSDDFTLSGSGRTGGSREATPDIDPRTALFAEAVGVDMSKPEVAERIKKSHGRKTYNNWG